MFCSPQYFNHISIEDSRVYELTKKAGLLSPYQILHECLKRYVFRSCFICFESDHNPCSQNCVLKMQLDKINKRSHILVVGGEADFLFIVALDIG